MNWSIDKIVIENFKFFGRRQEIKFNGKNVLIYGENGSGKSSIYTSFYTLFQTYSRVKHEAQRHFLSTSSDHSRNIYQASNAPSAISVTFTNNVTQKIITISDSVYYPDDPDAAQFMRRAMMASDFLNYRFVTSLFDFRYGEENEIFSIFQRDFLPYIDLDSKVPVAGGMPETKNAADWLKYLRMQIEQLPHNRSDTGLDRDAPQYADFKTHLDTFNNNMSRALYDISQSAQSILKQTFSLDFTVKLNYDKAKFDQKISARKRSTYLTYPRIYINVSLQPDNYEVKHPIDFFNEAKLTCIALAIRFAILERRPPTPLAPSVIFIDDLLLSLDMSIRRKVLNLLFSKVGQYQIVFLTHERSFYNMVSNRIEYLNQKNQWLTYQMYSIEEDGVSSPTFYHELTLAQEARLHLRNRHLAACGNAIRRYCETILKQKLPQNLQVKLDPIDPTNEPKMLKDLNGLIDSFNVYLSSFGAKDIAPILHDDRQFIYNPFSHQDMDTPYYLHELDEAITQLERLEALQIKQVFTSGALHTTDYLLRVNRGAYSEEMLIHFTEHLEVFTYQGQLYINNPRVMLLHSSTKKKIKINKEYTLKSLYPLLYNSLSYNVATAPPVTSCLYNARLRHQLLIT